MVFENDRAYPAELWRVTQQDVVFGSFAIELQAIAAVDPRASENVGKSNDVNLGLLHGRITVPFAMNRLIEGRASRIVLSVEQLRLPGFAGDRNLADCNPVSNAVEFRVALYLWKVRAKRFATKDPRAARSGGDRKHPALGTDIYDIAIGPD